MLGNPVLLAQWTFVEPRTSGQVGHLTAVSPKSHNKSTKILGIFYQFDPTKTPKSLQDIINDL